MPRSRSRTGSRERHRRRHDSHRERDREGDQERRRDRDRSHERRGREERSDRTKRASKWDSRVAPEDSTATARPSRFSEKRPDQAAPRPGEGHPPSETKEEQPERKRKSKWTNASEEAANTTKTENPSPAFTVSASGQALQYSIAGGTALNYMADNSTLKRKIFLPKDGVNYIGLLIGPKGMY